MARIYNEKKSLCRKYKCHAGWHHNKSDGSSRRRSPSFKKNFECKWTRNENGRWEKWEMKQKLKEKRNRRLCARSCLTFSAVSRPARGALPHRIELKRKKKEERKSCNSLEASLLNGEIFNQWTLYGIAVKVAQKRYGGRVDRFREKKNSRKTVKVVRGSNGCRTGRIRLVSCTLVAADKTIIDLFSEGPRNHRTR